MGARSNEYRLYGVLYVFLGFWFNFNFFFMMPGPQLSRPNWFVIRNEYYLLVFLIIFIGWLGSFVLSLFGVILLVRGGMRVARVSGGLYVFLLICYVFVLYYPIIAVSSR